jgi:hypothetical protein
VDQYARYTHLVITEALPMTTQNKTRADDMSKSKKQHQRKTTTDAELIAAGEAVVAAWERGDLAAAVRRLDATLQSVRLATKG